MGLPRGDGLSSGRRSGLFLWRAAAAGFVLLACAPPSMLGLTHDAFLGRLEALDYTALVLDERGDCQLVQGRAPSRWAQSRFYVFKRGRVIGDYHPQDELHARHLLEDFICQTG